MVIFVVKSQAVVSVRAAYASSFPTKRKVQKRQFLSKVINRRTKNGPKDSWRFPGFWNQLRE
jgi:hypothetical protein